MYNLHIIPKEIQTSDYWRMNLRSNQLSYPQCYTCIKILHIAYMIILYNGGLFCNSYN